MYGSSIKSRKFCITSHPDLEGYRPLGYLRYLEHQLRNIRLDDPKFEQSLLSEAKARELEESRMRRNRTSELQRHGFPNYILIITFRCFPFITDIDTRCFLKR